MGGILILVTVVAVTASEAFLFLNKKESNTTQLKQQITPNLNQKAT